MSLQDKYKDLISQANSLGVSNLEVTEQEGVLYVKGTAPSQTVKDQLWDAYEKADVDLRSADVVLNIDVAGGAGNGAQEYVVKSGDNLSKIAKNYPGLTWNDIFEANKDQIKDPNLIQPGQKLKIPQK